MLPQEVVGDARGYELTGNATQHSIAAYFFDMDWPKISAQGCV
jgi:hypothetical protein